jgi:cytochrome d ubiquinol oxidase subunit II
MSQSTLAALSAILVWVALIAYAVSGGADFGGGIWDLLARGSTAEQDREAIARGMGPVWESNNIWLIFVLVVTWTAFPIVFASVSTALFIPITLVVIGIVLRGAAFSFRSNYGVEVGAGLAWGHIFNIASTITPLLFGTMAGALASGGIRVSGPPVRVQANPWTTWTTPFALACGAFAMGLCSVLAATYLTADTRNTGDTELAERFRSRALIAGAVTALIGALATLLAISEAPTLWRGLIGRALPLSIAAIVIGLATAVALLRRIDLLARALVVGECVGILLAWGVAQWPYLIVPDVTVDSAASPASVLGPMLIVAVVGLLVVAPALWYLFSIFKRRPTTGAPAAGAHVTTASFVATLQPPDGPAMPPSDAAAFSTPAPTTVAPDATRVRRFRPWFDVLLATIAAPLLTNTFDTLRQVLRSRGSHLHLHHRAPAP